MGLNLDAAVRNFAAVQRALAGLLMASGHFIASFEVSEGESPGVRGWIVTYQHGGRYLLSLRPIPDNEVARMILGDAAEPYPPSYDEGNAIGGDNRSEDV